MNKAHRPFRDGLRDLVPRLRRFGRALTGNEADGDDLLQDALEKALRSEGQFAPGTRLDSWVFRIMHTTFIDQRRRAARRPTEALDTAGDPAGEDGRATMAARLDLDRTQRAMAALSGEERATLTLVAIDGLSYREAAEAMDVPIGTVMSRLARARSRLAALLAATPEDTP